MEVSSFARSLGQSVGQSIINNKLSKDFSYEQRESISDILECAGLIHDIGNPPFGHFGESAIQDWCKNNFVKLTFKEKKIDEILKSVDIESSYLDMVSNLNSTNEIVLKEDINDEKVKENVEDLIKRINTRINLIHSNDKVLKELTEKYDIDNVTLEEEIKNANLI